MNRKFSELVHGTMSAESQERARRKTEAILSELALEELRTALSLTQEELAEKIGVKQASLSKVIRGQNMHIATLDKLVRGMGGELELHVVLPDTRVRLNLEQFRQMSRDSKKPVAKKGRSRVRRAG